MKEVAPKKTKNAAAPCVYKCPTATDDRGCVWRIDLFSHIRSGKERKCPQKNKKNSFNTKALEIK